MAINYSPFQGENGTVAKEMKSGMLMASFPPFPLLLLSSALVEEVIAGAE